MRRAGAQSLHAQGHLDRAIKKGAGLTGEVVNYEHVIYEGFADKSPSWSNA